ncbi:hypothetical protein PF005_g25934 [Phytophthora fragariae]|nr:hypothetical protein PF005_g25934 [Phytophthora fragariae]KAE9277667.1 hypothetical protein PF001_g25543 [Phytophthora fragariae]
MSGSFRGGLLAGNLQMRRVAPMRRTSSSARISSGHEECRNSPVILGVCVHEVVGISANVQAEMAEKNVQAEMAENEVQADMAENEPVQ